MELRAGVEPLGVLLSERWKLVQRAVELRARYVSFGTWEHERKGELSRLKSLVRLQALRDKEKLNNDQVDERAHEHPDYTVFIATATKERAEFYRLEAQIEAIDMRVNRGQALLKYATYAEGRV